MDDERSEDSASIDATFGFDSTDAWLGELRAAESPQEIGRLGAYRILEEAQMGGQGVVFRAIQPETNRQVALKRLRAGRLSSERARQRFEREIEAVSSLHHPGIVTVFGVERVDGLPILAMEWIDGAPITDWVERQALGSDATLRLYLEVCDAIHHAHVKGLLHRDIKPSNVLVDDEGHAHVLDFGLAKFVSEEGEHPTLTEAGGFLGTLAYASPESLQGGDGVDVRSDVYSLGAMLYEMLTGCLPYEPKSHESLVQQQAAETLPLPSSHRRGLPGELDAILVKALRTPPEHRYQSVEGLAADVRRFLAHEPVAAHPPSSWYELRTLVRRNRAAFITSATVVLALAAFALSTSIQARKLRDERNRSTAAEQQERLARKEAEAQERLAKQQRDRSDAVLAFFLDAISSNYPHSVLRREMRVTEPPTVVQMLEAAARKVDTDFRDDPLVEAMIRWTIGNTLRSLEKPEPAAAMFEEVLAMYARQELPVDIGASRTHIELGKALRDLGREKEALAHMETGLEILQTLENTRPRDLLLAHLNLANGHRSMGEPAAQLMHAEAALRLLEEVQRTDTMPREITAETAHGVIVNAQADALLKQGRYPEARQMMLDYIERPSHPLDRAGIEITLAQVELEMGRFEDAEKHARAGLDVVRERVPPGDLILYRAYFNLSEAIREQGGGRAELESIAIEALENYRARQQSDVGPKSQDALHQLRLLALQLSFARLKEPALEVAADAYTSACDLFDDDIRTLGYLVTYGETLCLSNRRDEAEAVFAKGFDLVQDTPDNPTIEDVMAITDLITTLQTWRFPEMADLLMDIATDVVRNTPGVPIRHATSQLEAAAKRHDRLGEPGQAAELRAEIRAMRGKRNDVMRASEKDVSESPGGLGDAPNGT